MRVDNQRNTYRIWVSRLIMTIIFTLVIIVIIFLPWLDNLDFWLTKYHLMILVALIYIIINVINYLKRPYFVAYSDHGEMIMMRYYPLSLFASRKHSIEIPKKQLIRFELQDFLFKTQQKIILVQRFRSKEARYPPVSLSAVDKEDQERIIQSLGKYIS